MLAFLVEIGGLLLALIGGFVFASGARGARRLLGGFPLFVYLVGQAIPIALADVDTFPRIYPIGLGVMALGGLAGVWLVRSALRRPAAE